jgi:hypothetical protein
MVDSSHREFGCHQNAGMWARDNPGCKVVHGWLVFDHEKTSRGLVPLVNFNPHSIIEGMMATGTMSRQATRHSAIRSSITRVTQTILFASFRTTLSQFSPTIR